MAEERRRIRRGQRFRKTVQRIWAVPVFRRIAAAGIILALVAAVAAYRNGTGFDVLRRFLHYGGNTLSGTPLYSYEKSSRLHFASVGNGLAVLSDTSLQLFDSGGNLLLAQEVHMKNPALYVSGKRAAAWDVGGTELYVIDASGEISALTANANEPFLMARLNRDGLLAVTSGKQGYKGAVMVYDPEMKPLYEYDSAERFLADAYVMEDNSRLAALTLGQEDGVFVSNIALFRMDREEAKADVSYDVRGTLALELRQQGQYLTVLGDACLHRARTDGTEVSVYDYNGAYLREYSLDGDGFAALLLNRYQSGSVGRIVTVSPDGEELGSLEVREEILELSAAGHYLAVLYADRLMVYSQDMRPYASLSGVDSLHSILMRSDGSVLLLEASSARIFSP